MDQSRKLESIGGTFGVFHGLRKALSWQKRFSAWSFVPEGFGHTDTFRLQEQSGQLAQTETEQQVLPLG